MCGQHDVRHRGYRVRCVRRCTPSLPLPVMTSTLPLGLQKAPKTLAYLFMRQTVTALQSIFALLDSLDNREARPHGALQWHAPHGSQGASGLLSRTRGSRSARRLSSRTAREPGRGLHSTEHEVAQAVCQFDGRGVGDTCARGAASGHFEARGRAVCT